MLGIKEHLEKINHSILEKTDRSQTWWFLWKYEQ